MGSVVRFAVTRRIPPTDAGFPVATLLVNLGGSFALGLLIGLVADQLSGDIRSGVFAGLLGGLTTYSTFAFESASLFREGLPIVALANVVVSVVVGLTFAWLGVVIGEQLAV